MNIPSIKCINVLPSSFLRSSLFWGHPHFGTIFIFRVVLSFGVVLIFGVVFSFYVIPLFCVIFIFGIVFIFYVVYLLYRGRLHPKWDTILTGFYIVKMCENGFEKDGSYENLRPKQKIMGHFRAISFVKLV